MSSPESGVIALFFTDGISEAMNGASELFGESRLERFGPERLATFAIEAQEMPAEVFLVT